VALFRYNRRRSKLPNYGGHNQQNAETTAPNAFRKKSDSCYKQEKGTNSAGKGQHYNASQGKQNRPNGKNLPT
jgi:hypothetical protein